MASRQLYKTLPDGANRKLLATFELSGKKLKANWEKGSERYQADIENNGIVYKGLVLVPKDGKAFFDALPRVYSSNSTMYVVDS